jgi:hypothetical protein
MADVIVKDDGRTIIDGQEFEASTWHCSRCGGKQRGPAFQIPESWVVLKIEVGGGPPHYTRKDETRVLCPACGGSYTGAAPQLGAGVPPMRMLPPRR